MGEYAAPLQDMNFVLTEIAKIDEINQLPGYEEATPDLVEAVLEEASKFATDVLSPLNKVGDTVGAKHEGDEVTTAPGWKDAYKLFAESGWSGLSGAPEFGGQGLPKTLATAVDEMWNSANMAFAVGAMLTTGAVHAIEHHANDELKSRYIPPMLSGEWTGTMNLTEPQAGSDLSQVRTKAIPQGDHYLISGQKIYITYGEHDLSENIVHLVLGRTPDAPEGTRGISLFIVPKFLVNDDGSLGARNDLRCASIEHKLGIHGSPTAVMIYGDNDGAVGYLVGEENKGLMYMFTMMNAARHAVGLEGVALSERAYQHALEYARDRIQGKPIGAADPGAAIIEHPDVRRMLMEMKAKTEAMRSLAYVCAAAYDKASNEIDEEAKAYAGQRGDFLTPIVKGWCTEVGNEVTSLGLQIHGGMGYVEETGAAQYVRDARITTIYEGTTGIQAGDLIGRKTLRDGGSAARELIAEMQAVAAAAATSANATITQLAPKLRNAIATVEKVVEWVISAEQNDPRLPAAASVRYLMLWGNLAGGWQLTASALAAERLLAAGGDGDQTFLTAKISTASFYAFHVLPQVDALAAVITEGSDSVFAIEAAAL
ncbi:MAG: acyl-CoA dehydrogenase [Gammaproteobacteria bacterium]